MQGDNGTCKTWIVMATDERTYGGNMGYDDQVTRYYSWNSRVPNAANIGRGDVLILWDKKALIGYSVVEKIETASGVVDRRRCPRCAGADIRYRRTMAPDWRCQDCRIDFDEPLIDQVPVTEYRAYYAPRWVDLPGALSAAEVRTIALAPRSQHSMREASWATFVRLLRSKSLKPDGTYLR